MRGHKTEIDNAQILDYVDKYGQKAAAEHFNLALTTVHSILERLHYFDDFSRIKEIELSEENVSFIRSHTMKEICINFHKSPSIMRTFINKNKLQYLRYRTEPKHITPIYTEDEKKNIYNLYKKEHELMNITEIAKKYNVSKARVSQILRYGW